MDALTQQLMDQLSGQPVNKISKQIGADRSATTAALSAALPLLISALANNASKPQGAQALHNALANDHNGSILDDVPAYLNNPQAANGAGILGHVLGAQQPVVTQGLNKATGLTPEQISMLLQIAAPLVLGLLGKQQQQQGFDPNGLASFLGGQQQIQQQSNPDMMGVLNTLLDSNRDGSAIDDVIGLAGKLFGGS